MEELRSRLASKEADLARVASAASAASKQMSAQINALTKRNETLTRQVETLQSKLDEQPPADKDDHAAQLQLRIEELEESLRVARAFERTASQFVVDLSPEAAVLQQQVLRMQQDLDIQGKIKDDLARKVVATQADMRASVEAEFALRERIATLEVTAEKDVEEMKAKLAAMEAQAAKSTSAVLHNQINEISSKLALRQAAIDELKAENAQLRAQLGR